MQRLTVVKVWYQNDFGRTGLRDERLTRALLADPRVGRVVHLEPPLEREGRHRPLDVRDGELRLFTPTYSKSQSDPWPDVIAQTARFLAEAGALTKESILWVSAPGALGDRLLAAMGDRFGRIVAEVEDDHREYAPPRSEPRLALQRRYERIVRASDLLVSNNATMIAEWSRLQRNAACIRNAVDAPAYAREWPEPRRLAGIGRPRITYAGNLRLRLEPALFAAVARAFPQATLLLAGIGGESLLARLPPLPNVRWLGAIPPADVPALLTHSDVLVMPHAQGALTDSMDPQKVYEYLASGRPIVATPVAGAREQAEFVALAPTEEEFVAAVGRALQEKDPAAAQRRRARGTARSWEDAAREVVDAALKVERPLQRWHAERALGYFQHERPEVRRLVPAGARRLLDVGCGAGAVGSALKFERDVEVVGIELDKTAAARAKESLDSVVVGDAVASMSELQDARFDAVLFADLLEHLPRPELALAQARRLLAPGGVVVASLPNVRHWSVVRQLLEGDFRYEPAGILDRTHLRFFTRQSAQRLLQENGFTIESVAGARWAEEGMPDKVAAALSGAGLDVGSLAAESREHQWLFVARPVAASSAAEPARTAAPARSVEAAVTVIVPVCNAVDYTRSCLDELRVRGGPELEIVVVDNGSSDGTAELLAGRPELRVIRNAENRGFAGAVNQGLAAARAPIVCVLNNDTLLTEGWLEPMAGLLAREPSIALIGPVTSYAKGRQQVDLTLQGRPLASLDEMRELAASFTGRERGRVEDVGFLSGFCFVGRLHELRALGGLAEAYGRGTFEDDELCRRLRRSGRRLAIARDAYVHHFGNRTFRELGVDLARQQEENFKLFASRHGDDAGLLARAAAQQERWGEVLALALAALKRSAHDLDALALASLAAERVGRSAEARRLLERYLARCPFDREALARRDRCESASGSSAASRNVLPGAELVAVGPSVARD